MTIECSCRLCPSPGMYAVTSNPFVSLTRATLRSAEFGFFGVVVYTRVHTPRFCGLPRRCGAFSFFSTSRRPCRTSWLMVGKYPSQMNPKKLLRSPRKLNALFELGQGPATGLVQEEPCLRAFVQRRIFSPLSPTPSVG